MPLFVLSPTLTLLMDVDHDENDEVAQRYDGDAAAQEGQAPEEEEEVPRNPAKCVAHPLLQISSFLLKKDCQG